MPNLQSDLTEYQAPVAGLLSCTVCGSVDQEKIFLRAESYVVGEDLEPRAEEETLVEGHVAKRVLHFSSQSPLIIATKC